MFEPENEQQEHVQVITETCPHCGRKVRATIHEFEIGVVCPRCKGEVRTDIDENSGKSELERDISEILDEKTQLATCPKCNADIDAGKKRKLLERCEKCNAIFAGRGEDTQGAKPPSDMQLKIFKLLGFLGQPSSAKAMSELILTINTIFEDAICEYYNGFKLLPQEIRNTIVFNIAKSDLFPKVYFDKEALKFEEIQLVVEQELKGDGDLIKVIANPIDRASFQTAERYIIEYAYYIYGETLDLEQATLLTLKSFARNLGSQFQQDENIFIHRDDVVEEDAKPTPAELEVFYSKEGTLNSALSQLMEESSYTKKERTSSGCLLIVIGAFTLILFGINSL